MSVLTLSELLSPNTCNLEDSRKKQFRQKIYRLNFEKNNHNSLLSLMCIINSEFKKFYQSLTYSGNRSFIKNHEIIEKVFNESFLENT
ncbi:hypothetical protein HZS_6147 [Henneguya salminicola]|nr:hypothetical protein HZS_6147 [Henneguya salminicola]